MQARLGQRISGDDLQRARAARDLPAYLQQVRSTALARHVGRLTADMDAHEAERRLREQWGSSVEEVARWLPVADAHAEVVWPGYRTAIERIRDDLADPERASWFQLTLDGGRAPRDR